MNERRKDWEDFVGCPLVGNHEETWLSHQVAEDPWMPQANATATLGLQILKHTSVRWGEDQDPELFPFGLYILPTKSCDIGSNPDLGSLELSLKVRGIPRIVSVDVSGVCGG